MSYKGGKQGKNLSEQGGSPFLRLLPVAYNLEASKQKHVFKMLNATKLIEKQHERTKKKFRLGVTKAKRKGMSLREKNFRKAFILRIFALADDAVEVDTQKLRAQAIKTIQELIDEAIKHGKGLHLEEETRIAWVRTIGYLFQVLKSVMREFDHLSIKEDLKRLKLKVNNELRKRNKKSKRRS